jgi:hypothetical protein
MLPPVGSVAHGSVRDFAGLQPAQDVHSCTAMSRRVVLAVPALLLGGCDLLFQLDEVHAHPDGGSVAGDAALSEPAPADVAVDAATSNCTVEHFDVLPAQWRTFARTGETSVAIDGTLSITLTQASDAHGGTDGAVRDYTGTTVDVDIVSVPDPASEMYMDWQNSAGWSGISIDHGQISYGYSINGTDSTIEIPYVADKHRGFRLRHDPQGDLIHMYTRDSGGQWSLLGTVPAGLTMTSVSIELAAGSYTNEVVSGAARFDNFTTCRP